MANPKFFKPAFDELATDGCIGDPNGQLAYAYIRVSHSMQAEDGRSGLPRQIKHVHQVGLKHQLKIPWELVFADDHSGFEFEGRPALTLLRKEYKSPQRRAGVIAIEHIDRLSRNADWHQGFLLDETRKHGIEVFFWKAYSSRIERAVMGAIAQEGMEQAFERQREGTLRKAQRGCVTSKVAAFGFRFVDDNGQEGTKAAREHTHYATDEGRAYAVRYMFNAIAYRGMSSRELLIEVDKLAKTDPRFLPPRGSAWNERTFVKMLRNPVYKGDFIANRWYREKVIEHDEHGMAKTVMKNRQRPEEEWIHVPVPAIVDEATWELANYNLYRNKGFAKRNKRYEYLLTELIRCATCGRRYHGWTDNKPRHIQRYMCSTMTLRPAIRELHPCGQTTIRADVIEPAVWAIVANVLLKPDILAQAIDARYSNDQVESIREQIAFLEREIEAKGEEENKLYKAYMAEAYTAQEYAAERQRVIREREVMDAEKAQLELQVMTPEELEEKKRATLQLIEQTLRHIDIHDAPFELKQRVLRLLIDEVRVNVREGWFEMRGTVGAGIYRLVDDIIPDGSGENGSTGSENIKPLISL